MFFILFASSISTAVAQTSFEVQVHNVTQDIPALNVPVTLQIFENDVEIQRFEIDSDSKGNAKFNLEIPQTGSFTVMASALYKKVRYFSDSQFVSLDQLTYLVLNIYDPTRNKQSISISSESAIIFQQLQKDSLLHVVQITTFENSSEQSFIGTDDNKQSVLNIPLPPMAFDVQNVSDPGSLEFDPLTNQLYSTVPALPGINEVVISYKCLYTGDSYMWSKTFPYPYQNIVVALPSRFTINENNGWESTSIENLDDESYTKYSLTGKSSDSGLLITNLPLSEGSQSKILQESVRIITVWSTIIIALLLILSFIIRNRLR